MRPEPPAAGAKYRILVVEDDINIARLMMVNLARAGFECRHAPDGLAGLQAFQDSNPHLILLDVMMPGMSGRDLCAKIRETSTVPIIMMTALSGEDDQVQGFKLGADDYVPKPFSPKLLVARVVSWLRRVYRYDEPVEEVAEENTAAPASAVPAGWATCESCGYIGPRQKFETQNASGRNTLLCPYCLQAEFVTFSIA